MSRKYSIVPGRVKQNKADVIFLGQRNLEDMSEARYARYYKENSQGNARFWLAKEEESDIFVGMASVFPRKFYVNCQPVWGGIAADFAINKEHRGFGPALRLQRIVKSCLEDNGYDFIYVLPNKMSEPVFKRVGYLEVGQLSRFVKLLRAEYKLRNHIPSSHLAKYFSKVIDFVMKKLSKEHRYKRPSYFSVETPQCFDGRFDHLWQKVSSQFKIIGARDSKYLNWKFAGREFKTFVLVENNERIAGYIIYYVKDNINHIIDMLFLNSDLVFDALFSEFINDARQRNIDSIFLSQLGDNNLIAEKLKEFGFFLREDESKVYVCFNKSSRYSLDGLLEKNSWYLLEGDRDI